nr:hypothetical protein [Tanacetum cinerariifolium]
MGLVKVVRSTWGVRVCVKGRIGYGRVQGRLHWLDCLGKMPVDLAFNVDFQSCVRYCLIQPFGNKWYQSLLRSFDQKKNNTQTSFFSQSIQKMVKSSSSSKNEVFDDTFWSTSCKKNTESLNTKITELSKKLSDGKTMLYHYKLGLSHVEARLVEFKNQEIKFCEKIRGLEFKVESKDTRIERLTKELEKLKKEKEGSIMSKPMIKFVKADDSPKIVKTTKGKTTRKPPVRYVEMYRNTSKILKRVKRLEMELKARTPPIKIHYVEVRGRSRSVMAWAPKKILFSYMKGNSGTKRSRGSKSKEVVDYILQVKIKLLIKKLEDSKGEHQV